MNEFLKPLGNLPDVMNWIDISTWTDNVEEGAQKYVSTHSPFQTYIHSRDENPTTVNDIYVSCCAGAVMVDLNSLIFCPTEKWSATRKHSILLPLYVYVC